MSDVQSIKKQLHMQQWTAIIEDRIASGLKIDEYCEKTQSQFLFLLATKDSGRDVNFSSS